MTVSNVYLARDYIDKGNRELNRNSRRRGQALSEHGLLIALLVVLVISTVGFFGASASGLFNSLNSSVNGGNPSSNPSSVPTSNPSSGSGGGDLIISDPAPALGQTITLTGSGFKPHSPVRAVLHSDPIVLKTQAADGNGNITMEVRIPPTIDLGHHLIVLEGINPSDVPLNVSSQPLTISANPISLTAHITSGPLYSGNYASVVYIFAATTSGGSGPLTYTWAGPSGFSSSDLTPSYSFSCAALPGSATFSVTDGLRHEADVSIALAACPRLIDPQASITAGPTYGDNYANVTYTFTGSASDGQSPLTTGWTGPGSWTSAESVPTQTFACGVLPGNVTYTATDANGQVGQMALNLPVCTPAITLNLSTGNQTYSDNYANTTIALQANVAGGATPYTYAWTGPGGFTSTALNPSISNLVCTALPSVARLTVTDAAQKSAQATVNLPTCTPPLVAQASITTGPLYDGNYSSATYIFSGSGSGGAGNLTYSWAGPGGFSSSEQNPSYMFSPCTDLATGGVATLTVSDGVKTTSTSVNLAACPSGLNPHLTTPTSVINGANVTYTPNTAATGGHPDYLYTWTTNVSGGTWSPTDTTSSSAPTLMVPCANVSGSSSVSVVIHDTAGQISSLQSQNLTVCPVLTIAVQPSTKVYGDALPTFAVTYNGSGIRPPDASLSGTLTYSTAANTASAVNTYDVVASGLASTKYKVVYTTGSLTITAAPLTITASNQSKLYGATLTLGTTAFTNTALVNGDSLTAVTLTSTGAASDAAVGPYDIVPSVAQGTGLSNYNIAYGNGTLTVNALAAPIFVAAGTATANASNITLTIPAAAQVGDLLLASASVGSANITLTIGSGWTQDCLTSYCSSGGAAGSHAFYSKVATAGDLATQTVTISGGASTFRTGAIAVYRNAVIKSVAANHTTSSSYTDTASAVNGSPTNSLVVAIGSHDHGNPPCTSITSTPSMTQRAWICFSSAPMTYILDYALPGGGSLAAPTFSFTDPNSHMSAVVTYVLSNP